MRHRIVFETTHEYEPAVRVSQAVVRLIPQDGLGQTLHESKLVVTPPPDMLMSGIDTFGNPTSWVSIEQPHRTCTYVATLDISTDTSPDTPADPSTSASTGAGSHRPWEHARDLARNSDRLDVRWCRLPSPLTSCRDVELHEAVRRLGGFDAVFADGKHLGAVGQSMRDWLSKASVIDPEAAPATSIDSVLTTGRGDVSAVVHLAIALFRAHGISARYVQGFLQTVSVISGDDEQTEIAPYSWLSLWNGTGWVDFDPSIQGNTAHDYLRIAVGRDLGDTAPVHSTALGGPHARTVTQRVLPLQVQVSTRNS